MPAPCDALSGQRVCEPVDGALHFAVCTSHRTRGQQGELRGSHLAAPETRHEDSGACPDLADLHAANGVASAENASRRCQIRRAAHDLPGPGGRGGSTDPGVVFKRDPQFRLTHRLPGHEKRADATHQETLPSAFWPALCPRQLPHLYRQTAGQCRQVAGVGRHSAHAARHPVQGPGRRHGHSGGV